MPRYSLPEARRRRSLRRRRTAVTAVTVTTVAGLLTLGLNAFAASSGSDPAPASAGKAAAVAVQAAAPIAGGGGAACPAGTGADLTITKDCTFTGGGSYGHVTIEGARVSVADADQTLQFKSLLAMGKGAAFLAGCPTPITKDVRIVLTEKDKGATQGDMLAGVLGAHDADFCLKGARVDRRFDEVDKTYAAGATSAATKRDMNLRAGDRVLFTTSTDKPGDAQVVTVTEAAGRTFSFTPALRTTVLGETVTTGGKSLKMYTEVARLSGSNLSVRTADGALGHVMTMGPGGTTQISGVDLRGVGHDFKAYCVHLHLMGDSPNSYVEHSACESPDSRAFVMHGTNKARFEDLVAYDTRGSSMLLGEGGPENGNLFKDLLAANPRATTLGTDDFDKPGNGPSGIWSAATDNTFTNLHASGVDGGWGVHFDVARFTKNRGVLEGTAGNPSANPPGVVDGIVVHGVAEPRPGHVVDRFLGGAGVRVQVKGALKNSNKRWDGEYAEYRFGPFAINDLTAWQAHVGVWADRSLNITNAAVGDVDKGFAVADTRVDNCLAIGRTGKGVKRSQAPKGTESYDFKDVFTNCTFANYGNGGDNQPAIGMWDSFGWDQNAFYGVDYYGDITFENVGIPFAHPNVENEEPRRACTNPVNGLNAWVHAVGDFAGDGYLAFPCAKGGTAVPNSNLKLVPLSQRADGGPASILYDGSAQHADPFKDASLRAPLAPRTAPGGTDGGATTPPAAGTPDASPTSSPTQSPTSSPTGSPAAPAQPGTTVVPVTGSATSTTVAPSASASPTRTSTSRPTTRPTRKPRVRPVVPPRHRHGSTPSSTSTTR